MDLHFSGRQALVVGGTGGIGLAVAKTLVTEGASVTIAGRNAERLEAARDQLSVHGAEVGMMRLDISDSRTVEAQIGAMRGDRRIDVLVNSAGGSLPPAYEDLSHDEWVRALNEKFLGYVSCCRAALEVMKEARFGRIVNIVGTAGREPNPWSMTTGAVNAALLNYTRTLSRIAAQHGILVNAVNPGPTATDRWNEIARMNPMKVESVISQIPLGRAGEPDDVAKVVVFLASPLVSFVTGAAITVDGGKGASVSY